MMPVLRLARGERHLAAKRLAALEHGHLVPAPRRDLGGLQPGRTATDDDDLLATRGRP